MSRETRSLPVPEGLADMRVDVALSKLFGLSRTVSADLATKGDVLIDGKPATKSDKITDGAWLEVLLPEPQKPWCPRKNWWMGWKSSTPTRISLR